MHVWWRRIPSNPEDFALCEVNRRDVETLIHLIFLLHLCLTQIRLRHFSGGVFFPPFVINFTMQMHINFYLGIAFSYSTASFSAHCMRMEVLFRAGGKRADGARIVSETDQMTGEKRPQQQTHSKLVTLNDKIKPLCYIRHILSLKNLVCKVDINALYREIVWSSAFGFIKPVAFEEQIRADLFIDACCVFCSFKTFCISFWQSKVC